MKKTVIVAIAVLVSIGMASAIAQKAPGSDALTGSVGPVGLTDELTVLNNVLEHYKNEQNIADDQEYKASVDNIVDRLSVAKAIYQTANGHQDVDPVYQSMTLDEMFILFDKTYEPEDFVYSTNDDNNDNVGHGIAGPLVDGKDVTAEYTHSHVPPLVHVLKRNNHYQSQYDCTDDRAVKGSALSILTAYRDDTAIITGDFSYPENMDKKIGTIRNNDCVNFNHSVTTKRHDVMISSIPGSGEVPAQVCTLVVNDPVGSDSVNCNAFGPVRLTMITTTNTYDATELSRTTQLGNMQVTLLVT